DRIVFLRIVPFPPEQARGIDPHDWLPDKEGWTNEFTGPLTALASVRTTSQSERNSFSLSLLEEYANKKATALIGERVKRIGKDLSEQTKQPGGRPPARGQLPQSIQDQIETEILAAARAADSPAQSAEPIRIETVQFVFQL